MKRVGRIGRHVGLVHGIASLLKAAFGSSKAYVGGQVNLLAEAIFVGFIF